MLRSKIKVNSEQTESEIILDCSTNFIGLLFVQIPSKIQSSTDRWNALKLDFWMTYEKFQLVSVRICIKQSNISKTGKTYHKYNKLYCIVPQLRRNQS